MILPLALDYGLKEDSNKSSVELSIDYIYFAVNTKHKEGLSGHNQRMWGRVQRKLDNLIDNKETSLDLEQAEFDFIREALKDEEKVKFPPNTSKYVVILIDALEDAKSSNGGTDRAGKGA